MAIDLNTLFTSLGIVSGNTQSTNQYDFYKGIVWDDATITNNQKEFFDKVGQSRYDFFKTYGDERTFYEDVDDSRINDFRTFYQYAGQYLAGFDPEQPPVASFTTSTQSTTPDTVITFTNTTTGSEPITYAWDFGDGDIDVVENPTHSYSGTGSYIVTLTASNVYGVSSATSSIEVDSGELIITGGVTSSYTSGTYSYMVHTFESSDTLTVEGGDVYIDYLMVAGGGSGGGDSNVHHGGGGAGGMLTSTAYLLSSGAWSVVIGAGGSKSVTNGEKGNDTTFIGLTSFGGGASNASAETRNGGSGMGAYGIATQPIGIGVVGQGNNGGTSVSFKGGGGGGAGAVGGNATAPLAGDGGNGLQSDINGTLTYYAGGGGGGTDGSTSNTSTGGLGGGGNGGANNVNATSGSTNTGGGGGAKGAGTALAGNGGSGIVIIRYAI